jgi:hypothetical protein
LHFPFSFPSLFCILPMADDKRTRSFLMAQPLA